MMNFKKKDQKYKILIVGASGMIGHKLYNYFTNIPEFDTKGIVRSLRNLKINSYKIIENYNFIQEDIINKIIQSEKPDLVINCIGIVKQNKEIKNIKKVLYINSFFPKLLSQICQNNNIRLITFSTDCVFNGKKGFYKETDLANAVDTYGRTKFIGELYSKSDITLRTSFFGRELNTKNGLIEWFLQQTKNDKEKIFGYKKAIYSGLPTIEIAKIIEKYIIPNKQIKGLYHLSSDPIDKYSLLKLVNKIYKLNTSIIEEYDNVINRSLDSSKFRSETGFEPLPWEHLIKSMYFDKK